MTILDGDAAYGRGALALPRELDSAADLLAELDHCGIAEALVWHRDAFERDFAAGNARITAETAELPRLHPVWAFVPPVSREIGAPEGFVAAMRAQGVHAVRAFPSRHSFLLHPLSCGPFLELFTAQRIPVFVALPEVQNGWQGVYDLLRAFPNLTLVLTQSGCWGQDRLFRPLLRHYPRFHLTTNRVETAGQVEDMVDSEGCDRLLFGSGLPWNSPGGGILSIARAGIADAAREAILHGNLRRLLAEANP